MNYRQVFGTLIALGLIMFLGAESTAAGTESGSLEHGGLTRTYTLTVPESYDGETPVPLVIALHPYASSGTAMRACAHRIGSAGRGVWVYRGLSRCR